MKSTILFLTLLISIPAFNQNVAWFPVKDGLYTKWGETVDPENVLPEYPRPTMVRKDWLNLNGIWNFTLQHKDSIQPVKHDRQILVPFPVESSLSGLKGTVTPDDKMWYSRNFIIPEDWSYKYILLHIGASDWETTVYINGQKAGSHRGGYDPIQLDITFYLKEKGRQKIEIEVWDPTDSSYQPVGKQKLDAGGIWYTPTSGIWQTVWIEPVMWASINDINITPDLDNSSVEIEINSFQANEGDTIICKIIDNKKTIAEQKKPIDEIFDFKLESPKKWSPDNPFLYDIELKLIRNDKSIDSVTSYFGMRKISVEKDKNGVKRFYLNNKPIFLMGMLDQGFWPEGLYTPSSDEALKFDIDMAKKMGFNLLRKHVKVESERWYYHCDRLGMLVWQDMPNGDKSAEWAPPSGIDFKENERSFASESQYKIELEAIIQHNKLHPSIIAWVPFNEAWGQFKTIEITDWVKRLDPNRLVNGPSGGNFFPVGDIRDFHHYPDPVLPINDTARVMVLGEYGGLGLPIKDHTFAAKENWGYKNLKSESELDKLYLDFIEQLKPLINKGLSGAIYTQVSDVEVEINGLVTYDRKKIKPTVKKLSKAHNELYGYFKGVAN
jgi:beta-galactosidase/beta-glucuronidase